MPSSSALIEYAPPLHRVHRQSGPAYRIARDPVGGAAKRGMDIVLSLMALAVCGPFLLLIALMIRLGSPGPAIFYQWRAGFRGRAFRIFKLRTMSVRRGRDITQAQRNDPR